jgi:hypothetical protein
LTYGKFEYPVLVVVRCLPDGAMLGWAKEILVVFSVILALF